MCNVCSRVCRRFAVNAIHKIYNTLQQVSTCCHCSLFSLHILHHCCWRLRNQLSTTEVSFSGILHVQMKANTTKSFSSARTHCQLLIKLCHISLHLRAYIWTWTSSSGDDWHVCLHSYDIEQHLANEQCLEIVRRHEQDASVKEIRCEKRVTWNMSRTKGEE